MRLMSNRNSVKTSRICMASTMFMLGTSSTESLAQSMVVVDDVPGSFVDISSSQPLVIGDDEEIEIGTTIGNFVFPPGVIVVANNGGVAFRDPPSNDLAPVNQPIPSSAAFGGGQAVLVYWDDLDDKDGDVFLVQEKGRLIVQWHNRPLVANPTGTVRFQLQIHEDPGPSGVVAQLIFADIEQTGAEGGLSATIGYQDGGAGFGNAQWSFNTPSAVTDGRVLSLVVSEQQGNPVPAASGWAMIITSVVILTVGTLFIRRHLDTRVAG